MTALYDAVQGGLDRLRQAKHTRQVLVVISDGSDNASRSTVDDMLARVRSASAMIYTVALQDPVDRDGNPRLLKRMSSDTGGESFAPRDVDEVPRRAAAHRARYSRDLHPGLRPNQSDARRYAAQAARRRATSDGRSLKVQTRGGYVAPQAAESRPGSHGR